MGRVPRNPRGRKSGLSEEERAAQQWLFDLPAPEYDGSRVRIKGALNPIWSENKARLIQRYLYYFVMITKHGTYIDGFAGPQKRGRLDMWSAKMVLESRPRWLRHFYLCELSPRSVQLLRDMNAGQPQRDKTKSEPKRDVEIHEGDFNVYVRELLARNCIAESEATFCLLDQRMFECAWESVVALAAHKKTSAKIELFYFLPQWWFGRAFAAQKDKSVIERWWGRSDWRTLSKFNDQQRADAFCERFRDELKYKYAAAWPIYTRAFGGRIVYHMVHASDHPEAPKLMARAYSQALNISDPPEQLDWVNAPGE